MSSLLKSSHAGGNFVRDSSHRATGNRHPLKGLGTHPGVRNLHGIGRALASNPPLWDEGEQVA
jgi:hypothetical protein